jgi:hypothetical protein
LLTDCDQAGSPGLSELRDIELFAAREPADTEAGASVIPETSVIPEKCLVLTRLAAKSINRAL